MEVRPKKDKITTIFIGWLILFGVLLISYNPIHRLSEAAGERNIPIEEYNEFYFICAFSGIFLHLLFNWNVKVVNFDDKEKTLKIVTYNPLSLERIIKLKYDTLSYKIGYRGSLTIILYSNGKRKKSITMSDLGGDKEVFNKIRAHMDDLGIKCMNKIRTY